MKWKPVKGFEHLYKVSDSAVIINVVTNKLLTGNRRLDGYVKHDLEGKTRYAHRIVFESFNPKMDLTGLVVHHKDGVRHNNHLDNLEAITNSENMLKKNVGNNNVSVELTQYEINVLEGVIKKCKKQF